LSTTRTKESGETFFTVTHPFHPLYEQEFILFSHQFTWGENRVYYYSEKGELKSLPAQWTSVYQQEPFVALSNGRSIFHVESLLELVELMKKFKEDESI
jgi:hypothetical protein